MEQNGGTFEAELCPCLAFPESTSFTEDTANRRCAQSFMKEPPLALGVLQLSQMEPLLPACRCLPTRHNAVSTTKTCISAMCFLP